MPEYLTIFVAPLREISGQVATVAVCLLILMDWCFGLANALFVQHDFSSEVMRQGIVHKCVELGILLVGLIAHAIVAVGLVDLKFELPIFPAFAVYIIGMEIGSLLEIFVQINPDLADNPLFKRLASVNQNKEDTDGTD